tara:strand:- start:198 stop:1013 length:816 start_codon:yes stop_codon:yes gene_type:complete
MSSRIVSLSLSFFLLASVVFAPASAQAADDPKQPSVENPHMHFWGTDDLSSCWTHFDSNDSSGSSEEGHGAMVFPEGQQVDVSFTCRIQENFKENMYLNANGTIVIEVGTRIFSDDCDPAQDSNCKDFTMTLYKGNTKVASEVFPGVSSNWDDEQIRWEIQTSDNMTSWNKSQEEPSLQVEYSKPGVTDILCAIPLNDCTGEFWFYYSNNEDGMTAEANFPVINQSLVPGSGEEGGPDSEDDKGVPGFGLLSGLSALALALATGRFGTKEE